MGLKTVQQFNFVMLRKKPRLKIKGENLAGLIELGRKLKTIKIEAFGKRYENLLNLMEVKVQRPSITSLAQYYDSPLRCFTFQDFQLAPIVDEFEIYWVYRYKERLLIDIWSIIHLFPLLLPL